MPALPADIAAGTREASFARWADAAIAARYPSARDGAADPATGYFDALDDAQIVANARGALIGVERRRFSVTVQDVLWLDPTLGVPCVRLIDAQQNVDGTFLVSRIEIDLDAETTTLELFG